MKMRKNISLFYYVVILLLLYCGLGLRLEFGLVLGRHIFYVQNYVHCYGLRDNLGLPFGELPKCLISFVVSGWAPGVVGG